MSSIEFEKKRLLWRVGNVYFPTRQEAENYLSLKRCGRCFGLGYYYHFFHGTSMRVSCDHNKSRELANKPSKEKER